MKSEIKKNLWWIISSIVLFIPFAYSISGIPYDFSTKLLVGSVFFVLLFLIWAVIGFVANRIKKKVFKVLWIILGLAVYAIGWFLSAVVVIIAMFIAMSEPITEEDIEERKEDFRNMVYHEFDKDDHLDRVVGIELPQYKIADSECKYVSCPPTETEYNVKLKIYFPNGLPESVWNEICGQASINASNPLLEGYVINEWKIDKDNQEIISYTAEDSRNVGCNVTFKHRCDTVYVTRYKW